MNQEAPKLNNVDATKSSENSLDLNTLDQRVAEAIQKLEHAGLNMDEWNKEYLDLPNDVDAFSDFYDKLWQFMERREDALSSIEFQGNLTETEKEKIRQFDQEVRRAYKDSENFLGNGATAEVYGMSSNNTICVKFITNQERYNENNSIRKEHDYLSRVYEQTRKSVVRTPYPVFVRIHPNEGHSYGMEKIQGASLSQILEYPEKYTELIEVAQRTDRKKLEEDLLAFIREMHNAGVTHGDLYKRNIMLDKEGNLFVIDFGKAREMEIGNDREDERKSDAYVGMYSIREFFTELDGLTN